MSSLPNEGFSIDPKSSCVQDVDRLDLQAVVAALARHGPLDLQPPRRRRVADAAYLTLVTSGWMAFNMLGALGCAVAFFIVISAGQWDTFFLQVDNLTSRYVAADLGRRGMFEHYLVQGFMLLFAIITILRAPGFVRRVRSELAKAPRS